MSLYSFRVRGVLNVLILVFCVKRGARLGRVVPVSHNLSIGVSPAKRAHERQQRLLLRLGARIARLVVVVNPANIADAHGAVVHVALWAVLTALRIGAYALIRAVKMYEQVIPCVDFLPRLRVDIWLEVASLVPAVKFLAAHLPARRSSRAVNHYGVYRCLSLHFRCVFMVNIPPCSAQPRSQPAG